MLVVFVDDDPFDDPVDDPEDPDDPEVEPVVVLAGVWLDPEKVPPKLYY